MAVDAARARTVAPDVPTRAHARPRPRPRKRAVPHRRLAGGVVWIGLLAVLLTGIVALNVAVLQLNLQLDQLGQERARLRTENDELRQKAAMNAVPETMRESATIAGYHPINPAQMRYLDLEPDAR
jgi:cell division protein FtsB